MTILTSAKQNNIVHALLWNFAISKVFPCFTEETQLTKESTHYYINGSAPTRNSKW